MITCEDCDSWHGPNGDETQCGSGLPDILDPTEDRSECSEFYPDIGAFRALSAYVDELEPEIARLRSLKICPDCGRVEG